MNKLELIEKGIELRKKNKEEVDVKKCCDNAKKCLDSILEYIKYREEKTKKVLEELDNGK